MTLFIKRSDTSPKQSTITNNLAMQIYNHFKNGLDEREMFLQHNISTVISRQVKNEIVVIESSVTKIMNTVKPRTKNGLIDRINSEMFSNNISQIVNDVIIYHDSYNQNRTYIQFKALFTKENNV